jgi:hypothetical protein
MLCERCNELLWDLKAARKGVGKEISYCQSARRVNIGLRQDCNACRFFSVPNGALSPNPHPVLAMPLLLSFSLSSRLFLTCLLLEKEHNVYKRIGALVLEAERRDLESDYGLKEIVCQLGEIKWAVKPCIEFVRHVSQLQQITIV